MKAGIFYFVIVLVVLALIASGQTNRNQNHHDQPSRRTVHVVVASDYAVPTFKFLSPNNFLPVSFLRTIQQELAAPFNFYPGVPETFLKIRRQGTAELRLLLQKSFKPRVHYSDENQDNPPLS